MQLGADAIRQRVREAVGEALHRPAEEIPLDAHLYYDMNMTSSEIIGLLMILEERFDIDVSGAGATGILKFIYLPDLKWTIIESISNMYAKEFLDALGLSDTFFDREKQLETFAAEHGVSPYSVGLLCVCVEMYLARLQT
jgi:acyl carrier protein